MPFDVEYYNKRPYRISVQMTLHCSHRCWYCNQGEPFKVPKETIIDLLGEKEYIRKLLLLAGDRKAVYLMFGGEPLSHKSVVPVSQAILEAGHTIFYQTNGTMISRLKPLKPWREQINFESSFHLGTYSNDGIRNYMTNVIPKLKEIGHTTKLIIVCVPEVLAWDLAGLLRLIPDVKYGFVEFYGHYQGRQYPAAYSAADRQKINDLRKEFKQDYADSNELSKLNNTLFCKGVKCVEQTKLLRVNPYGGVSSCNTQIGNLAKDDISFTESPPKGCLSDICGCVSMGYMSCLKPNGITLEKYWEVMKDAYLGKPAAAAG